MAWGPSVLWGPGLTAALLANWLMSVNRNGDAAAHSISRSVGSNILIIAADVTGSAAGGQWRRTGCSFRQRATDAGNQLRRG